MSDDLWADLEAAPVNLFLYNPVTSVWCPRCLLPSALRCSIGFDPAMPSESTTTWCPDCKWRGGDL